MERIGKSLTKLKLRDTVSVEQLACAAWPAAVGKTVAAHSAPRSLVRGSLIVDVADGIWQRQLFSLRHQILGRLSAVLGSGIITGVEFRVPTPRRPPQPALSLASRDVSPHSDADEADRIQDPVLRIVYRQARKRASA